MFSQTGQLFTTNFSPKEYGGDGQIWTIVQDNRGVMYFGGNTAVYEFDGTNWNIIETKGYQLSVRSMAVDSLGRIYVGSVGDMGFLKPNYNGKLEYVSIVDELDSADRQFTDVWTMATSGTNAYFCSNEFLFRYNPDSLPKFKVIGRGIPFFLTYKVRDEIFVSTRNQGLYKIAGDTLINLPGSKNIYPWILLPYENNKYLIGTSDEGLLVWNPNSTDSTKIISKDYFIKDELSKTEDFLLEKQLYLGATYIGNDMYAFSTILSGVIIVDKYGKIVNIIDKQHNLLSQTVHYLFLDNQQQLWAGLTYGISYIETNSPFQYFNDKIGLNGSIYNAFRTNKYLFASSNLGLFYWENNRFNDVDELAGTNALQVFNPMEFHNPKTNKSLVVVTTITGMFKIVDHYAVKLNDLVPNTYIQSRFDSTKIWISEDFSLFSSSLNDELSEQEFIAEFDFFPYVIAEYDEDNLWLLKDDKICLYSIKNQKLNYFENNPELQNLEIYDGKYTEFGMLFYTNDGFYTFNNEKEVFEEKNTILNRKLSSSKILQFEKVSENSFWTSCIKNEQKIITIFNKTGEGFTCDTTPFKRLFEYDIFHTDGDSIMWIISPNSLFKFDVSFDKNYNIKNNVLIRKIICNDSVIFNGAFFEDINGRYLVTDKQNKNFEIVLDFKNNDLRFEFALPEYDNSIENTYSYLLIGGKTQKWSAWTTDNYKEFSNIREGNYVFRVKAKNIYGYESEITEIKFKILPPWYRTIWAFILYLIFLGFVIWLVVKIYSIRLKKENERLDKIVKQRTAEINQQNEEIKTQAENLSEINKLLSEKNEEVNQQNEEIKAIADSLQDANDKIKQKNRYITDSINYAKRIQEAVLPSSKILNNLIPEHFILFKPKDVISGDFYWVKKLRNHLLIIVSDCTGHGVPGGFIAMLGISILNEIVRRDEIHKPSQALEAMRKVIKSALKQTEFADSQDDGMDMGFVAIDLETNELTFSGAYIPLYIVRNKTIKILKPILNPIGIYPFEKPFVDEKTQLQDKDMIIMTTDGYKDQLGENNEQFTTKRLKGIIAENSDSSTKNQKQALLEEFLFWKKNNKQTDDVLVLGVRWKTIENEELRVKK